MRARVLLAGAAIALLAGGAAAQSSKLAQETGYVAAIDEARITLSNVPVGGPGAGPGGGQRQAAGGSGQPQMHVVRRGPDGKEVNVQLSPEEEAKLREQAKAQGGGPVMVMRNPDGTTTTRTLTPEEAKKMRETMQAQGGPAGATQGGSGTAAARPAEPMKLSDFTLAPQTRKDKGVAVGAKVVVHYREEDGKKVAARIELAK